MGVNESEVNVSFTAGADLSALQFRFVKLSTSANRTVLQCGAGDYGIGVLNNKPANTRAAEVQVAGIAKVTYGASVTAGDPLTSDAAGKAITQTGQNPILAYALASGSAGETHTILLVARPVGSGVAGSIVAIPVDLHGLSNATYATFVPGFAFTVKKVTYVPVVVSSTTNKLATVTAKISGTGMTGGVLALTTANTNTLATNVAGSAVSAANTGTATDSIDLVGSSVTTFIEGSGVVLIELQ